MRRTLFLALALGLTACASQPRHDTGPVDNTPLSLISQPASLQRLPGHFRLDASTTIVVAPGNAAAKKVATQLQGWIRQAHGTDVAIVEAKPRNGAIVLLTDTTTKGREAYTLDVNDNGVHIA